MKVLDPGHVYELSSIDADVDWPSNRLLFVKRDGPGYPGNVGHHPGTNLQEVMRALIDRVLYLDSQIQDDVNAYVVRKLRECICALEHRAARRHGRMLSTLREDIENEPVCVTCGHIGCDQH